ncbi:MAG: (4Fe-4S)-binding protein [Ferruginibacter sp.]
MSIKTHKYTRSSLTVIWQPERCIHSGICAKGLSAVFNPTRKPWIDLSLAEIEEIIAQVKKCPSGALSIDQEKNI